MILITNQGLTPGLLPFGLPGDAEFTAFFMGTVSDLTAMTNQGWCWWEDKVPVPFPKPDCIKQLNLACGKIFPYSAIPRFLERKIEKAKVRSFSWHSFRHLRASIWATENMSVFEIMHRLGHNNMPTTMKYLQLLGYNRF